MGAAWDSVSTTANGTWPAKYTRSYPTNDVTGGGQTTVPMQLHMEKWVLEKAPITCGKSSRTSVVHWTRTDKPSECYSKDVDRVVHGGYRWYITNGDSEADERSKHEHTVEHCPDGWWALGFNGYLDGANRQGCGIGGCDSRFQHKTVDACKKRCEQNSHCGAFSFAPVGGDPANPDTTVCTIYRSDQSTPNKRLAGADGTYSQIFCKSSDRQRSPFLKKQHAANGRDGASCGYMRDYVHVPRNLDAHGHSKKSHKTKGTGSEECAKICRDLWDCIAFEYNYDGSEDGKCITYTGLEPHVIEDHDQKHGWISCVPVKPLPTGYKALPVGDKCKDHEQLDHDECKELAENQPELSWDGSHHWTHTNYGCVYGSDGQVNFNKKKHRDGTKRSMHALCRDVGLKTHEDEQGFACKPGYSIRNTDCPGFSEVHGRGGGEYVKSCDACGELCDAKHDCNSYECSPTTRMCNLNSKHGCHDKPYGDFMFCHKDHNSHHEYSKGYNRAGRRLLGLSF